MKNKIYRKSFNIMRMLINEMWLYIVYTLVYVIYIQFYKYNKYWLRYRGILISDCGKSVNRRNSL